MSAPLGSQLFNYDAAGNAKMALVNGAGGMTPIANMAALQALAATSISDGQVFLLQTDGSLWRYAAASVLTTDTSGPFLVATATAAGAGAFLRVDREVNLLLPATFANADASVLWTVPTGFIVQIGVPYWHITTTFAGGSSSAIGLSSSNAGCSTKGDLLGGASGDVTATLVSTGAWAKGTVGAKIGKPAVTLVAADAIRYDQITSTYTSGVGVASVPIKVLLAPAA